MATEKRKWISPFETRITAKTFDNFDQYYLDVEEKTVFKSTGQKDDSGDELGVSESKLIIKKIDIHEYLDSQSSQVGIDHYIHQLALQGVDINELNTVVNDKIVDMSKAPETLADLALAGDKAKAVFDTLDPALKGNHTTIEGFLGSLSQSVIDDYIKRRVDAIYPTANKEGE